MATRQKGILNFSAKPDNSDEVYWSNLAALATNDVWDHYVLVFEDGSTRIGIHGKFRVPQDYVGTANLVVVWAATATSGDIEADFDYRAVAVGESLDQSGNQESVNANDTAAGTAWFKSELTIALTDANFTAGDTVQFTFFRDNSDAGDTMAASMVLFDLLFEYSDA